MEDEYINLHQELLEIAKDSISRITDNRVKYLSELQFECYIKRWERLKHRFIPYPILKAMFQNGDFDSNYEQLFSKSKENGSIDEDFAPSDAYLPVFKYLEPFESRIAFFEHPLLISIFLRNYDIILTCIRLQGRSETDVIIGTIPDNRVAAKVISLSDTEHLIVINEGYIHFLHFILQILFAHRQALHDQNDTVLEQTVSLFADGFVSYLTSESIVSDITSFNNLQFYGNHPHLNEELLDVAITFVIAHEYFHLTDSSYLDEVQKQAIQSVKQNNLNDELVTTIVNYYKESQIDCHASYITYMAFFNVLTPEVVNEGVALAFGINDLVMKFLKITHSLIDQKTNTHPPYESRMMGNKGWGEIIFDKKFADPVLIKELEALYDKAYPRIVIKLKEYYR